MRYMLLKLAALCCCAVVLLTSCAKGDSSDSQQNSSRTDPASSTAEESSQPQKTPPVVFNTIQGDTEPYSTVSAVYCVESKTYNFGKNLESRISIASTTKLLTASVALKYMKPDAILTAGSELGLINPQSTTCYVYYGCEMSLSDLLGGLLIPSGNDAAYVIAVNVARAQQPGKQLSDKEAVDHFCKLMNDFAQELGMTDSHFVNPDGWDDPQHYSTAADMVKLAEYALTVPEICETMKTAYKTVSFSAGGYATWTNNNYFVIPGSNYYSPDALGMKTGTTENAGYCLITAFKRNSKTYICLAMGCNTDYDRFDLTQKLLESYT
ncbi:D-alanyl-D-alanine carboxypeptidase [Ruminococcus sp. FC2018]|uniref:D-alanyl-D-alanine carboxypeptidase family protein n=1 Tax=Ruminococcus sp. FC2018 TaxID=1410617 RepID=UPI00048FA810|nr:D-alanyl-D-alanine carboxypeptidase [Ruminococcus sp. FC2018]